MNAILDSQFEALANRAGDIAFERLAEEWARNYDNHFVPEKMQNMIAIMVKYGLGSRSQTVSAPDWQSSSYKFQKVVDRLTGTHWRQMCALKNWYFWPNATMEMRLEALQSIGIKLNKSGYYATLAQGKALVRSEMSV